LVVGVFVSGGIWRPHYHFILHVMPPNHIIAPSWLSGYEITFCCPHFSLFIQFQFLSQVYFSTLIYLPCYAFYPNLCNWVGVTNFANYIVILLCLQGAATGMHFRRCSFSLYNHSIWFKMQVPVLHSLHVVIRRIISDSLLLWPSISFQIHICNYDTWFEICSREGIPQSCMYLQNYFEEIVN
jgi:hypothetical protein